MLPATLLAPGALPLLPALPALIELGSSLWKTTKDSQ